MTLSSLPKLPTRQSNTNSNAIVERCFVINLDRRPDRLEQGFSQVPNDWPFPQPERFAAIDGRRCATPPQWRAGNGAWGCYRSHCLILEKCLLEGIDSYAVFEDDAGFVDGFSGKMKTYADALPSDWALAYLGGQHLFAGRHPPLQVSESVYRPYNVNRTHAFMVSGRQNMKTLYRHLHWSQWKPKHHIDHHLGRLTQRSYVAAQGKKVQGEKLAIYSPAFWMSGQLPSKSNICGKTWKKTRFFNNAAGINRPNDPFFAVLGPHRSGTSCVAMVMHHLGVHMGNQLSGYEATGGGEAVGLAQMCENAMRFPAVDPAWTDEKLSQKLKSWIGQRKAEANRDKTVAGAKYPHLCRFAEHLHSALGDSLRIITVDRDIEASIRSLQSRSEKHRGQWFAANDEECEQLQRSLLEHRDNFIAAHPKVPVFRIEFAELTTYPEEVITNLIEFLGIEPTEEEIASAIDHVNPDLRKHG